MRRQSVLNGRHRELGARLDRSWNGVAVAERYDTDPYDEVAAVRYRAGLIDISSHNIVHVEGPQAAACLDHILTTDITRLKAGDTHCSNIVDDDGALIDDVLVYCDAPDRFRLSHGEGQLQTVLAQFAGSFDVAVRPDDDVHVLSLQGPASPAVLAPLVALDLGTVPLGVHRDATMLGAKVSLVRGGFFGETGFEIFCASADAGRVWDGILAAGRPAGIMPVSWRCLEIARVEAGLLFFPYDMARPGTTPWEVGADWTVDLGKPDFRGKAALAASRDSPRSLIAGLEVASHSAVPPGAPILLQGVEIGRVTSAIFSRHLMKSLAMAQITPGHTALGTRVEIQAGGGAPLAAHIVQMPFYDPLRLRTSTAHTAGG